MGRHHRSPRHAGPRALATALACIALATAALRLDIAGVLVVPTWTVALALLVYTALAAFTLGRASLQRRSLWVAGAGATHLVFVVATAAFVAATGPASLTTALLQAVVESALVTIIFVIGAPLMLLPFRDRLLPRPVARAPAPRPGTPGPPLADLKASAPPAGETPFAREARRRTAAVQSTVEPAMSVEAVLPPPPLVLPPPALPVVPAIPMRAADEDTVRIPFTRIAAQLPAEAFVVPVERLAESMRSPHELLVPRSLVLAQLGEGRVEVPWTLVEDQFPTLGFALETSEIRTRYPDLRLSLPLDLVVRQVPPEVFSEAAPAPELAGLDRYPAPFQPFSGAPAAVVPAPVTPAAPAPPPALPPEIAEAATVERPVMAATASVAPPITDPVAAAPPPVETTPPAEVRPSVVLPPSPPASSTPPPELLAQGERLAGRLVAFGPLEVAAQTLGGTNVSSLVTAGLPQHAIERAAVRCAPLLATAHQVTIHTDRVSMVLRAVRGGVLVIALRAGSPLALLEILLARACADGPPASAPAGAPRGLAAAALDGRVSALGGALQGFGPVVPAAFVDRASGLDVYVFSAEAEAAEVAGEAARVVWQALVHEGEHELGRAVSVVLREGTRRTVVHPVATAPRPAMLAAAGVLALPGRAYREAAQAAERLATA
jgi:hypothetical protein